MQFLKVYDKPVMYFPKFFHPDPTVERQSGFLKPQLNNSEILGSSIFLPYFHVISESKDLTLKPTIFDTEIKMYQSEYRQENLNSSFIADINLVKGYESSSLNKKSTLTHFFSRFEKDLNLTNYLKSFFSFVVEKSNNDTYLRVFDTNLIDIDKSIKPSNIGSLNTGIKLELDHENYNFSTGMDVYENLTVGKSSDKYQYILPYYNFSKEIYSNNFGSINLNSSGSNKLSNTNNLRSRIINDFNFSSFDFFSKIGIKNNLNVYVKNLNTVGKK
jgi:LPS-assembly protein